MRQRFTRSIAAVLIFLVACSPQEPASNAIPKASDAQTGAWGAVDSYSDEVQEAARFAVQKQAVTAHSRLIYKDVQSAQVQVVAGLNFRMKLVVMNDGVSQNAVATVWRNLQNQYQLTEWQWSAD